MNKFLTLRLRRFVPVGLIALAAAVLLAPAPASATTTTPFVVNLTQQGSNVVATGSGEFDLSGLTIGGVYNLSGEVDAGSGYLVTGGAGYKQAWSGATGPANFGTEADTLASTGTGDAVGIDATDFSMPTVYVPFSFVSPYVSGTMLSSSSTWDNASFASLGMTIGTYVWSWGPAADQSFTLIIGGSGGSGGVTAVPEPAAIGMFGLGLLLIGGFVALRRRVA